MSCDLTELIDEVAAACGPVKIVGDPSGIRVTDVVHDSRQASTGSVFVAVPGAEHDGRDFCAGAVAAGASALILEHPVDLDVCQLVVESPRAALAPAAATCWGHPARSLVMVGITGTNGKTTTAHLVAESLAGVGRTAVAIGTLSGARTTPESSDLQRLLAQHVNDGVEVVVMEVSSHALTLARVDHIVFDVAVFTNLSQDHLGFHGTMESYFSAKSELFTARRARRAVVSTGDVYGRLLVDTSEVPITPVALDLISGVDVEVATASFVWRDVSVRLRTGGRFSVLNALLAAEVLIALGHEPAEIATALAEVPPVPGRFEPVRRGQDFDVIVDFAHTPDALAATLETSREVAGEHRLILVFGCGGDRDRSKRPEMGRIAARLADVTIVTNDNPRSEPPAAIISEIVAGANDPSAVEIEPDRRSAIGRAIERAESGDVVIIAGKGHETTQTIGTETSPFDDRAVAAEALDRRSAGTETSA